ncbi:hypothetical protein [Niveispirillum sp. KHB5.9]|uniref:hypothetical protein n=1 Tax=Niveispirillum sp. KHB5.9 TaxID=3400269 RepID=UPI003A8388D0
MKNVISALILSTLSLLAAGPALADMAALSATCGGLPATPSVVKGDTADETAMRAYGTGMRQYTGSLMTYLNCLDEHPASAADMSSAQYRRTVIAHRQQVVDQLEQSISRFNTELREFRSRQAQVAAVP